MLLALRPMSSDRLSPCPAQPRGHALALVQRGEHLGAGVLGGLRLEVAGRVGAGERRRRGAASLHRSLGLASGLVPGQHSDMDTGAIKINIRE